MAELVTIAPWPARLATPMAERLTALSRPRSRHFHVHPMGEQAMLFVVNGSQVYTVEKNILERLEAAAAQGEPDVERLLHELGLEAPPQIDDAALPTPPVRALSLAVAQKCNLACTYCYADQGGFGGPEQSMSAATARAAVDLLLDGAQPGERFNLAFMGGEPLANREVVREATDYAVERAKEKGAKISFSITTNGTLVREEDGELFERNGFAVTISLDGLQEEHDRQRPFQDGKGSFKRILSRLAPLLERQRRMQISVRASITPGQVRLRETLDYFLDLKFHSVGFSPVLRSPSGKGEHNSADLMAFLEAMVECGLEFERRLMLRQRYAFSNIVTALREIHQGTHRPYPCGAGAGYFGVSAEGQLAACHRFVGDENGRMGDLISGINPGHQARWLSERHVHQQTPCGSCWARYLCGGGCHHEVMGRGRVACDYVRGWLLYCLQAYHRLNESCPEWFHGATLASGPDKESQSHAV